MQNRNIVLFSSGISEKNGILKALSSALSKEGYICEHWRDLFASAKNADNIALLPMLIKKIPTFDYAVLICEGHDVTHMQRNGAIEIVNTMRDNVLFEIGLCVMALGTTKTILVTDNSVHLPDDLIGLHNNTAIKKIEYTCNNYETCKNAAETLVDYLAGINSVSKEIGEYIKETGNTLSPIVVGAASSTACGYVSNFVFRTLEHIDEGVLFEKDKKKHFFDNEKIFVHIILPKSFDKATSNYARDYLSRYQCGRVPSARNRSADFRFELKDNELHIIDFPTTLVTSYDTARMILSLDADDISDSRAAERFTAKELNLYEATLKQMLSKEYLNAVLNEQYSSLEHLEIKKMEEKIIDIIENRLFIEYLQ